MSYSVASPPRLMYATLDQTAPNMWSYIENIAFTSVRVAGYISNARDLGMKVGDIVIHQRSDTFATQMAIVMAINATTGAADLSDGTAISNANTD